MESVKKTEKRKYNIVYLIDGLGMGGAERLMVPTLKNLDRDTFNPRVCVFQVRNGNPIADQLRAIDVPVDLLPIPYLRDLTAIPRLYAYLKRNQTDLVHTQLEFADTLGSFTAKLLRLPSVTTLHTMMAAEANLKSRLHEFTELFALRHFCNVVISVSEEARQFHLRESKTPPEKARVIYNGIDLSAYANLEVQRERASLRQEFNLPADATLLTTVAVLREPKGIQFMISALPTIVAQHPNAYYLIVGDGAYRPELEKAAAESRVRERILFAGQRNDIPQILYASDLFVLPTLTEALPTVLAEAMAAHLPIVASRVGGIPEMVTPGLNGALVAPGLPDELASACADLLANPEKMKSMGLEGSRIVRAKFDVRGQVDELKLLYLQLITRHGK
ncbi:MAG: glycosyltransferase [Anaerolineales bacterium]|nr:glycosyltransferase [Anaerolineales bacterium]